MPAIDWKIAIHYAQLVSIAYSVAPDADYTDETKTAIRQLGYEFVEAIYGNELATDWDSHGGETVTYGFIARSAAGELVVAVRGTATVLEWLHDAAFLFVPNPIHAGGGFTEDGFTTIYRSLRAGADPNAASVVSAIGTMLGAGGISTVAVTGHSLGGALASLIALDVALNGGLNSATQELTVYTYASPSVGELLFRHTYDSVVPDTYRVYNRPDMVPNCPLLPYFSVGNDIELVPPFDSVERTLLCWHSLDTYLWLMDQQAGGNTFKVGPNCQGPSYPGPK